MEIKKLMIKIRQMYKQEASDMRKAKQLKSFIELYKGKMELEALLKGKLGVAVTEGETDLEELSQIEQLDAG